MAGQPGRPGHDIRPGSCELAVDRIQRHWITGQAGDVPFVVGGTCSSPCCNQTSREGPGGHRPSIERGVVDPARTALRDPSLGDGPMCAPRDVALTERHAAWSPRGASGEREGKETKDSGCRYASK